MTNGGNNQQSPTGDLEAIQDLYKLAISTRDFEITNLIQRNNFFMVFQGVLFAGLAQSSGAIPIVSFMVCVTGLFVSLFQVGMASGAKFWQERWEHAVEVAEEELLNTLPSDRRVKWQLFSPDEGKSRDHNDAIVHSRLSDCGITTKLIKFRFSVSRIPIYTAIVFSIVWFLLILCTMDSYAGMSIPKLIVGFPHK